MEIGPTEPLPACWEVTDAELFTVPQLAEVVGDPMCTERLLPALRDVLEPPQVRTPALIEQIHPAETALVVHVKVPGVVGRVSVMVTWFAVPLPAAETVIV